MIQKLIRIQLDLCVQTARLKYPDIWRVVFPWVLTISDFPLGCLVLLLLNVLIHVVIPWLAEVIAAIMSNKQNLFATSFLRHVSTMKNWLVILAKLPLHYSLFFGELISIYHLKLQKLQVSFPSKEMVVTKHACALSWRWSFRWYPRFAVNSAMEYCSL